MRRLLLWPLLLAVSCAPVGVAGTETYYGFSIGIQSAPPRREGSPMQQTFRRAVESRGSRPATHEQ